MTESQTHPDASSADPAQPQGIAAVSVVAGVGALLVAVLAALNEDAKATGLTAAVVGVVVGVAVAIGGIRAWLAHRSLPVGLSMVSAIVCVLAIVVAEVTGRPMTGFALLAGLVSGLLLGAVWATRSVARRSRRPDGATA
jgi:chromate transport protein ChrA